jgi:phosphate transport system permease protein
MNDKISVKRRIYSGVLHGFMYIAAGITVVLLVSLIFYIFYRGLGHIDWNFLTSSPSYVKDTIGILPNILNTIYVIIITLIIVLPLGVGAAIYLTEYAKNRKLVNLLEFATETLAGIPSIIYGLVGMLFFVQFCSLEYSLLAGALTLVIVTLPTIIRTTQESLKTVPQSYREGSYALGANKWFMIRTVVLPSSIDGIITGCILAIGRIVGESAALLFTAGLAHNIMSISDAVTPGNPGATLTVALYVYAKERGEFEVAFAIASILLIITLIINFTAKLVGRRLKK